MRHLVIIAALGTVAACAALPDWMRPPAPEPAEAPGPAQAPEAISGATDAPMSAAVRPPADARTPDEFDTSSNADKAAAAAPSPSGSDPGMDLGTTIASLGAPGQPGFWLKTPLVTEPGPGRVVYPVNGNSAKVDLIPLDAAPGAGSRLSLAALRVIEAPLTGLPELRVFRLD